MSRRLQRSVTFLIFLIALLTVSTLSPGCGESQGTSSVSPVVNPESPEAKKALAETEKMLKDRQEAEAKAHKRRPKLPSPEPES